MLIKTTDELTRRFKSLASMSSRTAREGPFRTLNCPWYLSSELVTFWMLAAVDENQKTTALNRRTD